MIFLPEESLKSLSSETDLIMVSEILQLTSDKFHLGLTNFISISCDLIRFHRSIGQLDYLEHMTMYGQ